MMFFCVAEECPQAEYSGIAMEYGTQPLMQVLQAIRGEHWLHQHPEAPKELAADIKQKMLDAFYTDTPQWQQQIVEQGMEAMRQGVEGLAG
jgi:hypothetical protein